MMDKEKKEIVYVDMDGVVADFNGAIENMYPKLKDMSKEDRSKEIDIICKRNPYIFNVLPIIEGASISIPKLMKNYEVYFLSTPMWDVPESYMYKRVWLRKNFGLCTEKRLILSHRKDLNIGSYLIDDRKNNGAGEFKGKLLLFGSEEYSNWASIMEYFHQIKTVSSVQS